MGGGAAGNRRNVYGVHDEYRLSACARPRSILQVDEPSPAIHPDAPADFVALLNAAIEPAVGRARLGVHLCFGNFLGRPLAPLLPRPVLAAMLKLAVDPLVLEFANREIGEVGILAEIAAAGRDVAAGVIDVKKSRRDGRGGRGADRPRARNRAPARSPDGRPRLWVQPDRSALAGGQARALVAGRDLRLVVVPSRGPLRPATRPPD